MASRPLYPNRGRHGRRSEAHGPADRTRRRRSRTSKGDSAVDDQRFDHLARVLGGAASRRGLLAGFAALLLHDPISSAKPGKSRRRGVNRPEKPQKPTKPAKPDKPDKPGKPENVVLCHKPGTPAEKTLELPSNAVAAHLRHGDHLGECCDAAQGFILCGGHCCPPPPQGGQAMCCADGSCGCNGECCADACFLDDRGGPDPVVEFCCSQPEHEICETPEPSETCCLAEQRCECAGSGGIAGSYRRPGR
jgi:hypothetical protein